MISNEITNEAIAEATYLHSNERLLFHEHCGTLVKLTNNRRAAERKKPIDEFNNGVVMTNRPINDDEMFEVRVNAIHSIIHLISLSISPHGVIYNKFNIVIF